jgi:hypothetical protein
MTMGEYADDAVDRYAFGGYFSPRRREDPTCKHCGERCTWHHTGERWALMGGDGRLHKCSGDVKALVCDFEPL